MVVEFCMHNAKRKVADREGWHRTRGHAKEEKEVETFSFDIRQSKTIRQNVKECYRIRQLYIL